MAGQVHRFLELLQDRWGAVAFVGLMFWGLGWLDLSGRGAGRPIVKSAALAVAFVAVMAWGWMQQPIFLGQRWVALALIAGWAGLVRLCSLGARPAPAEDHPPAAAPRGPVVLRQPPWVVGVGCFTFLFFSAITLISNLVPNPTTTIVTTTAFAGFAILGGWVGLAALIERHSVSHEGIASRNIVGTSRFAAWSDVVRIGYNPQMQWFYVKDRGGRTFRLPITLTGIPGFASASLAARPDAIDPELRASFHALAKELAA